MRRAAEAIEEGVAIALAAARLQVKNRILIDTIAQDDDFDHSAFLPYAKDSLLALASEQERASEAVRTQRAKAWGRHSDPHGTHDYRDRDVRNLRKRAKQYAGVAKKLRGLAEDEDTLQNLVEAARDAAWHDVESTLERRLQIEAMRPDDDPDYDIMREARMQALRLVDLQTLASDTKKRQQAREAQSEAG
ncbi:asparagine synthase [Microbacterium amylolyticum]|uniref:Asparagine synthase n=1 Tax=Microbacterium amylolyticum TaxID=936337 RepID=A0ABS4ZGF9_9MICO|nr:asparagine synthase [Microbacterium amylolyticum]MBP2436354.1 hypothetical protein [Microbacterium amylolyticum]